MKIKYLLSAFVTGFLFTILLLTPAAVYAHAPKEVTLSYNKESQALTVRITHKTPSAGSHYIDKVEIKKNGTVISTNQYKSQPDKETFEYSYKIQASGGDRIEVKASCNFFGSKTVNLTIQ